MLKHNRKKNIPKWKDPEFPPRRKRNILFWLMDEGTENGYVHEIYFVNDTNEILDVVSTDNTGFSLQMMQPLASIHQRVMYINR